MVKTEKPPLSNTGAENTQEIAFRSLVDWLSFTLPPLISERTNLKYILNIFGLDLDDFKKFNWGVEGYASHYALGGIKIYVDYSRDYPYWFVFEGQGCRFYESLELLTWSDLIKAALNFNPNFKRIDLAIDDFTGSLDLTKIQWAVDNGTVRSLFHSSRSIPDRSLKDGSLRGLTIYFGSATSRINCRFYDKKLERLAKGKELEDWVKSWVRIEVQYDDERADAIANYLVSNDDVGQLIKSTLKKYIVFTVKSKDTNKARWKTVAWWDSFLGSIDKLKLTNIAPDATVEKSLEWIDKQVAPSLAMLLKAVDGNMQLVYDLIKKGEKKLSKKHLAMLNDFEKMKKKKAPNKILSDALSPYDYL